MRALFYQGFIKGGLSLAKKLTTEEFIEKARKVHGGKYDYSEVVYKTSKEKVVIICKKHGVFLQPPNAHLTGSGCTSCMSDKFRLTTGEFINKAKKVHGNKYDYSEVVYKGAHKRVDIICKEHLVFYQTPSNHLGGRGCPSCAVDALKSTTEDFIEKAKKVHGDKYDYSNVVYKGAMIKVAIICKEHGLFHQRVSDHLSGRGCPSCPRNYDLPTHVYILKGNDLTKIGIAQDIERRMKQHSSGGQPFTSTFVASFLCKDFPSALAVEKAVHKKLSHKNAGLEGFDGATEWFKVTPAEAADMIKQELDLNQCFVKEDVA